MSEIIPIDPRRGRKGDWTRPGAYVRPKRRWGLSPVIVALPLAVFTAVFFWGAPLTAPREADPAATDIASPVVPASEEELRERRWPTSADQLDAAQPAVVGNGRRQAGVPAGTESADFAICGRGARVNCVVDGDTFWYHGDKIRVADINTPEVSAPECAAEARLGARATGRMHELLNAGPFTLERIDRDRDRYDRLLRIVTRDGESLGAVLVAEGLAEEWRGRRRTWC